MDLHAGGAERLEPADSVNRARDPEVPTTTRIDIPFDFFPAGPPGPCRGRAPVTAHPWRPSRCERSPESAWPLCRRSYRRRSRSSSVRGVRSGSAGEASARTASPHTYSHSARRGTRPPGARTGVRRGPLVRMVCDSVSGTVGFSRSRWSRSPADCGVFHCAGARGASGFSPASGGVEKIRRPAVTGVTTGDHSRGRDYVALIDNRQGPSAGSAHASGRALFTAERRGPTRRGARRRRFRETPRRS